MKEVTYTLKHPFEYAIKGDMQSASFLTMTAPTYKQMQHVTPIKQAFMSAINDVSQNVVSEGAEGAQSEDAEAITGRQVVQLMMMWKGDMAKVMMHAEQLFKGVVMVEGETSLTTPLIAKMHMDDVEQLLGEYIVNFFAPSLMDGT